jgi:putative membrane protein
MAAIALLGLLYAARARQLRARGRPVPGRKRALFALALGALVVAVCSPIDRLGEERLFSAHMVQHLLLADLAPLLIVLALSGPLLRPALALPVARRGARLIRPAPAAALWIAVIGLWHVPALYDAALSDPVVHAVEHLCFFAAGLVLWAGLLEPVRLPGSAGYGSRLAALGVVWVAAGVLSNVLLWSEHPYYQPYADAPRTWGLSALADQRLGGGVMLLEMSLVMISVAVWLALRYLGAAEHRQRALDAGAPEAPLPRAQRAPN